MKYEFHSFLFCSNGFKWNQEKVAYDLGSFVEGGHNSALPELKPTLAQPDSRVDDGQSNTVQWWIIIKCTFNWFPGQVMVTATPVDAGDHWRASLAAHLNTYIYVWLTRNNELRKSSLRINPESAYQRMRGGSVIPSTALWARETPLHYASLGQSWRRGYLRKTTRHVCQHLIIATPIVRPDALESDQCAALSIFVGQSGQPAADPCPCDCSKHPLQLAQ